MPSGTYYVQECPTCGRSLQVRVEYLGKRVACQHCNAKFEACDPSSANYPPMESGYFTAGAGRGVDRLGFTGRNFQTRMLIIASFA